MDIPDIRRVVHWGLPSTIEEYAQESGRVGRDGKASLAILYQGKGGRHSNIPIKSVIHGNVDEDFSLKVFKIIMKLKLK